MQSYEKEEKLRLHKRSEATGSWYSDFVRGPKWKWLFPVLLCVGVLVAGRNAAKKWRRQTRVAFHLAAASQVLQQPSLQQTSQWSTLYPAWTQRESEQLTICKPLKPAVDMVCGSYWWEISEKHIAVLLTCISLFCEMKKQKYRVIPS